jgi:AcrR family transcriptional regulator
MTLSQQNSPAHSNQLAGSQAAIMDAFAGLLAERGYENVTVGDIIARADVGRTTFYRHFENKASLVVQLHASRFVAFGVVPATRDGWLAPAPSPALIAYLEDAKREERTQILICRLGAKDALIQQLHDAALAAHVEARLRVAFRPDALRMPLPVLARSLAGSASWLLKWWVEAAVDETPLTMATYMHEALTAVLRAALVEPGDGSLSPREGTAERA